MITDIFYLLVTAFIFGTTFMLGALLVGYYARKNRPRPSANNIKINSDGSLSPSKAPMKKACECYPECKPKVLCQHDTAFGRAMSLYEDSQGKCRAFHSDCNRCDIGS